MSKEYDASIKNDDTIGISNKKDQEASKKIETEQKKRVGKPVIISAEAYKTIILYASRYANQALAPENWKEIYGILTGYTDEDYLYVKNAYALTFGHETDVQLDEKHYVFIDEIQQKLDKESKDQFIVGWFHSHPGLGLFFSYIDIINQLGFQAKFSNAIGLVFDHTLLGKKEKEKIGDNVLTKYSTGFEIYRLTDINMDPNSPEYDNNYHKIDYLVDGLNKFFFANVLSELSALVSAGKPLQSAYGEEDREYIYREEHNKDREGNNGTDINKNLLKEIPLEKDIQFNIDDIFYDKIQKEDKSSQLKEIAEKYIFQGSQAFKNKDAFTGVENFRKGIEKYEELNDYGRVFELLKQLVDLCISNEHLILAEEFIERLFDLADTKDSQFYMGEGYYLKGYLLLKAGNKENLEGALKNIEKGAIKFEEVEDFAGAGMCFHKIGTIFHSRLNKLENSCLFYKEAMESYNKAIKKTHPLRKSLWNKPEYLIKKIIEIRDIVEDLLPNLQNVEIKDKLQNDLQSIDYNF